MADRALFVGFGAPARGREQRAIQVFGEFVAMFGRMQSDGRIEQAVPVLLDPHGGDLAGFFLVHGSAEQCAALQNDDEFRDAMTDAALIADNLGVVPAIFGEGVGPEMARYAGAVGTLG